MARPIFLIRERVLKNIYAENSLGVSYRRIINRYNLDISTPTLSKLLRYYRISLKIGSKSNVVHNSLFPEWLDKDYKYQKSSEWKYTGYMPLGLWEKIK